MQKINYPTCKKYENKERSVFLKKCVCVSFLVWVLSIDQFSFGDPSWGFVDPLKELAGALGALEIESVWVGS